MRSRPKINNNTDSRVGVLINRAGKTLALLSVVLVFAVTAVLASQFINPDARHYSHSSTLKPNNSSPQKPNMFSGLMDGKTAYAATKTTPHKINFQARLTDQNGNILSNGDYNMKFRLYDASTGGNLKWEGDYLNSNGQGVDIENGLFSIQLGSINTTGTINPALFANNTNLYLSIELPSPATATSSSPSWSEGEMSPRQPVESSPYAMNADALDGIDSTQFARNDQANTFTGTSTFSNSVNITGANPFSVGTGATTLGGSLNVSGSSTLNSLSVTNNATVKGGQLTLGTSSQDGSMVFYGDGKTATLQTASLTGNHTYTLPDASGVVCLATGNCTGVSGGSIGGSGTSGAIAMFTPDGYNIGDSALTQSSGDLTASGNLNIQGSNGITFGASQDTNIYRSAANTLKTDDSLVVATDLSVSGNSTLSGDLTSNGDVLLQNSSDSSNAFQIQNANGTQVLNIDNTDNNGNLITNGGFETNTTGWSALSSATISRDTTKTFNSQGSLKLSLTGSNGDGAKYGYSLLPNTGYVLSFYVKADSGSFTSLAPVYSEDGSTNNICSAIAPYIINTDWQQVTCSFTTGSSITGSPYIGIIDSIETGTVYIDGVHLSTSSGGIYGQLLPQNYQESSLSLSAGINTPVNIDVNNYTGNVFSSVGHNPDGKSGLSVSAGGALGGMTLQNASNGVYSINSGFGGKGANYFGVSARGTAANPQASNSGDNLLSFVAHGYDGSDFIPAGNMGFRVDGPVSGGSVPTGFRLNTGIGANSGVSLEMGSDGSTAITNQSGGSSDTLTVNNGSSTGDIFVVQDQGAPILTIADGGSISQTYTSTSTTAATEQANTITVNDTGVVVSGNDVTHGQYIEVNNTGATGGTIETVGGRAMTRGDTGGDSQAIGYNGAAFNADVSYGVYGQGIINETGTTTSIGVNGQAMTYTGSNPSTTNAYGLQGSFTMDGGSATITNAAGLNIQSASNSAGGTVTNNYGIKVDPQSIGTNDYGISVGAADTQTLWLSSDTDNTTANAGIAFGSSRDTNLYRSAANTLKTDSSLSVGGDVSLNNGKKLNIGAANSYVLGANFASQTNHGVGNYPRSVTTADLNGDGKPDMIVTNQDDNTVSVLKNTSSGGTVSFASQATFSVGSSPTRVTTADLNGDGKPDMIVTNHDDNTVSVLKNTSSGGTVSFASQATFSVGGTQSVTTADLNGDSKPEIITSGDSHIYVLKNTSSGGTISFASQITFNSNNTSNFVTTADLNGDSKPDVVVANSTSNTVSVLKNTSSGSTISFATKTPYSTGSFPVSLAIGDIDSDNNPDIVVANRNSDTISVLINNGDGTFASQVTYPHLPGSYLQNISLADMNGNGRLDAVVSDYTKSINILYNNGNSGFIRPTGYGTVITNQFSTVADLNSDSKPDIIALNRVQKLTSVLINTSASFTLDGSAASIRTGASNTSGLIIQGHSGQNADLLRVQDASGNSLLSLNSNGDLSVSGNVSAINDLLVAGNASISGTLAVSSGASFAGTVSGSSATNGGEFVTLGQASGKYIHNSTSTHTANLNIQGASSSDVVATIQGASSQSANLLNLKDSAGNVLSNFDSSGNLTVGNSTNTGYITIEAGTEPVVQGAIDIKDKDGNSYFKVNQYSGAFGLGSVLSIGSSDNYGAFNLVNGNGNAFMGLESGGTSTYNILLPGESGTVCLQTSSNCGFADDSGSSNYIQNGTSPQTANFNVSGDGSIGGNLSVSGNTLLKTSTNSTSALKIQNNSNANLLTADTSNMIIKIGTTGTPNLSGASLLVKSLEVQQGLRIGGATNYVLFDASTHEPILHGDARHDKTMTLTAKYTGAVIGTSGSNGHTGTMTTSYDDSDNTNYYNWTSSDSSTNDKDIIVQVPLPSDWSDWASNNPVAIEAYTSNTSQCSLEASVIDTSDVSDISSADILPSTASTWKTEDPGNLSGTYAAGGIMTLRLHMGSKSNCNVRVGTITLNYLSKF